MLLETWLQNLRQFFSFVNHATPWEVPVLHVVAKRFIERTKRNAMANLVVMAETRDKHRKSETFGDDRTCQSCGWRGHVAKDCKTYGVTEVQTYPQDLLGLSRGQTHPVSCQLKTRMLSAHPPQCQFRQRRQRCEL